MTLIKTALAASLAIAATEAIALSCNPGNAAAAWHEAQEVGEDPWIVRGRFDMEPHVMQEEGEAYEVVAQFSGERVLADGSTEPLEAEVLVRGVCINGDCGYVGPGHDLITFFYPEGDTLMTPSMPCSFFPRGDDPGVLAELLACMNDGPCNAETQY